MGHWVRRNFTVISTFETLPNGEPYLIEREYGAGPYNVISGTVTKRNVNTISVPITELAAQVKIEFWTAKLFGVHTYMAETVINRDESKGRIVQVNWPAP